MGITLSGQSGLLISAALLGFVLGALYDGFRFIRVSTRCGTVALFFLDVLFFLICAFSTFVFLVLKNEGRIRVPVLVCEALGAGIYYNTIGAVFIRWADRIDRSIKRQARRAGRAIAVPVGRCARASSADISKKGRLAARFLKKESKLLKIRLKVEKNMLYNFIRPAKKPKSSGKE